MLMWVLLAYFNLLNQNCQQDNQDKQKRYWSKPFRMYSKLTPLIFIMNSTEKLPSCESFFFSTRRKGYSNIYVYGSSTFCSNGDGGGRHACHHDDHRVYHNDGHACHHDGRHVYHGIHSHSGNTYLHLLKERYYII